MEKIKRFSTDLVNKVKKIDWSKTEEEQVASVHSRHLVSKRNIKV
ncbi:MAG: hypothetical protein U5K84_10750 [Alkalibacterium sp.]|nr:hypothetical protein [Alkalibacterium sp.]